MRFVVRSYGGTSKEGMAPATAAKDVVEYWQRKGAEISLKSVQAGNRRLLDLGHIVRRRTGSGWIIGITHSVRWWNDKTKDHISYRFSYWNDLFQQMDTNELYDQEIMPAEAVAIAA